MHTWSGLVISTTVTFCCGELQGWIILSSISFTSSLTLPRSAESWIDNLVEHDPKSWCTSCASPLPACNQELQRVDSNMWNRDYICSIALLMLCCCWNDWPRCSFGKPVLHKAMGSSRHGLQLQKRYQTFLKNASFFIKLKKHSASFGCGRCSQFDMEEEIKSNQQSWKRFPLQIYHTDLIKSSQGPKCVISTLERRHCGLRGPAWYGEAPVEREVGHHQPSKAATALRSKKTSSKLLQFVSANYLA